MTTLFQIELYMREYQESENQNEILAEREPLGIFHLSELSKLKIGMFAIGQRVLIMFPVLVLSTNKKKRRLMSHS